VQIYSSLYSVKRRFSFNKVSAFVLVKIKRFAQNNPLFSRIILAMLLIYSKQKPTGSLLDSVLNANDNIARIILENKGLF
jgi:hypothetical protein